MRALDRRGSHRAHARAQVLLSGYLDDALPARKRTRIERHIRACDECRQTVTSVPNTLRMLRSLKAKPPPTLVDGVIDRLGDVGPSPDTTPAGTRGGPMPQPRSDALATPGAAPTPPVLARARDLLVYCLSPAYLRRSIPIALVIGIALTAIYQLGDFTAGRVDAGGYVMCACNFIVPFVLVSVGLAMARSAPRRRRR